LSSNQLNGSELPKLGRSMTSSNDDPNDITRSHIQLVKDTIIGHYRIIERIGAGGMGEVYLAEDTKLHRKVALKFLPLHLCQDPECRARFTREAEAAAQLDHPNIVAVHEVGEYQGRPFFSMQHVEGQSLKEVIAGKTLTLDRILEIGIQVCDGLQAAHEKGITHRDIKPSNILIDSHGRARIVDFGLASVMGLDHLTKTGSTLGTIGYMSPEQVRGETVDHRTDLFSLGVVLYELITSHSPFKGDSEAATLHAITDTNPEPLARFRREVPPGLQAIIDKALDKKVSTRYQHADELSADLKRLSATASSLPSVQKRRIRILVPSLVILGVVVAALVLKPWQFEVSPRQEARAANNWLAVMYFDNVADPDDGKRIGRIATNLLITGLSQSKYLQVLSSQRLYDLLKQVGKEGATTIDQATASQIAKKAQAKWMLTGSILQSEPTIVLTSELVDVAGGGIISSQRVSGNPGENIFAVIDRLTEEVKKCGALPVGMKAESLVPVANVTTNSPEAYRYYLEGMEYYYKYYSEDARRCMQKAIEHDSTFAEAYAMLAIITSSPEESDRAITQAMKFIEKASERERQLITSLHYRFKGDYDKSISVLQRYLERFPDDKEFWFRLGADYRLRSGIGGLDSAVACFDRALALDSSYRLAQNMLAYTLNDLGRHREAIDAINKYVQMAPHEANPYDSRGDMYAAVGNLDSALISYEEALSIKPDFTETLKKKGLMEMFLGKYQQAESTFRAYFSSLGKSDRGFWRASLIFIPVYRGRFHEALRVGDECIAANKLDGLDSTNWVMYGLKAVAYDQLGQPDSALAMIETALTLADKEAVKFGQLLGWQAVFAFRAGDTTKSKSLISRLKRNAQSGKAGDIVEYWDARGTIALNVKDYPSAVEYLARADSAFGQGAERGTLAEAYLGTGNRQRAIDILEQDLIKYDEGRAWALISVRGYYLLGKAYDEIGEREKAVTNLEKFLTIWKDADPGLKEVDDAKARLARLKTGS
jgi:serine/threonine protein kinase/tetratricopeptide (TPR) repeat protein